MTREKTRPQLKGAFSGCRWCGGNGCLGCDHERELYMESMSLPIFTAHRDDPDDMAALNRIAGADALNHAFGPDGGGMQEVKERAAIESLVQAVRKSASNKQGELS